MRVVCVVVLALLLAGGAADAHSARNGTLMLAGMLESRGDADLGSAPGNGELLRFIPRDRFEIGVLLENRTGAGILVTGARVLESSRSLVRQIGTRFHRWNPPTCPPGASCPAYVFPLEGGPARPRPFAVARGKELGIELDFQLGSCAQIPKANPAPISRLRLTFRLPDGEARQRIVPLGSAELHLRMPEPNDCIDPRSSLSVDGPQQYESSNDWTIPGSTGDVCTISNGWFEFVSREYQTDISRPFRRGHYERVRLQVRRFDGTGTYRSLATVKLVAGHEVVFRSQNPVVRVTKANARQVVAKLDAGRLPSATTRGSPFRIYGTLRCRVTR